MPPKDFLIARKGTAAEWAAKSPSPVLVLGEIAVETDTHRMKCGDGVTAWSSLPYLTSTFDLEDVPVQVARDTDTNLIAGTTPFLEGQIVYNTTTNALKIGDGSSLYSALPDYRNGKFSNVITVSKTDKFADFCCADSTYEGDDSACIQAAIDYCAAQNISELYINDGQYTPQTQINITHSIKITCSESASFTCNVFYNDSDGYMLSCTGNLYNTLVCTSDIVQGSTSATVSDTTGIKNGDLIIIYDDTIWNTIDAKYVNMKTGEMHEVINVDATHIYFLESTLHAYTIINTAKIQIIHPISVELANFNIEGISDLSTQIILHMRYCKNSKIYNSTFNNSGYAHIMVFDSYDISVFENHITNSIISSYGYGVSIDNASAHVRVHDNVISRCKHCVATGSNYTIGQSRDTRVYNNDLYCTIAQAVDAHECTESLFVYNNTIRGDRLDPTFVIISGAKITKFYNNSVYDGYGAAIRGSVQNITYIVDNNEFYNTGYLFSDSIDSNYHNTELLVSVSRNHVFDSVMFLAYTTRAATINVDNNTIDGTTDNAAVDITNATNGRVINNDIKNAWRSGIRLVDCSNFIITGNKIVDCCQINYTGQLYEAGIALCNTCNKIEVYRNIISDATGKMRFAIREYDTSNTNKIINNTVSGGIVGQIRTIGTSTIVTGNYGHYTENTGTATILATTTSIVVSHGLALTPTKIVATPYGNVGSVWVDPASITSTQFTIHCSTAPAADTVVGWSAVV